MTNHPEAALRALESSMTVCGVDNKMCYRCKSLKPPNQFHRYSLMCKSCRAAHDKGKAKPDTKSKLARRVLLGGKLLGRDATLAQRIEFWTMPEPNSGCLLWIGCVSASGYATVGSKGAMHIVSRLLWTELKGEIPHGMLVCHKCDTRRCVNIDHLFLGTPSDNMLDMTRKCRGRHKLTAETVLAILSSDEPCSVICERYGTSETNVRAIRKRQTWVHLHATQQPLAGNGSDTK